MSGKVNLQCENVGGSTFGYCKKNAFQDNSIILSSIRPDKLQYFIRYNLFTVMYSTS